MTLGSGYQIGSTSTISFRRSLRAALLCFTCVSVADFSAWGGLAKRFSTTYGQSNKGGSQLRLREPRIQPLEERDWTQVERELLDPIRSERGSVPNIYRTLARHPKLFTPRLNFLSYIQRGSTLPASDREILICRIAWLSRGEYEWSAHTRIGMENGLTSEDIGRISRGPGARGWSPFDATLMRAADELHADTFISDETWNALARRYDAHQMMDLVMTVGGYHMLAMALNSFGVQLEAGTAGFPTRSGGAQAKPRHPGGLWTWSLP